MNPSKRVLYLLLSLPLVLLVAGCSMTVNAVNPRPNVVVAGNTRAFAIDVHAVADDVDVDRVHIHQFRESLLNGFRNAVGEKFAATPDAAGAVRLVLEPLTVELSNLGNLGRFLTIRYRAKWIAPNGGLLAEVAGVAEPRNPTETGPRHLEDVIEVMYERMIDGYDRATHPGASAPSGAAFR